ncbi:probable prolyl 4-hydroxylase 10 [Cucumis sativus]|uniref:probable prolyl 4-hydroxylase 10 n=1 Tax=Cucumis sativus TaxID=3659 RepID=UPI0012F4D471|nr:probable prolyl 4-hydroxylase 10 [Cucumis sativus]
MERSLVSAQNTNWEGVVSSRRTSSGRFLAKGQNQLVRRIEKRIAEFTFIPVENGEGLSILHYEVGQKFEPHHDYTHPDSFSFKSLGQRNATLVMYLSGVKEGGATVFPEAKKCASSARRWWKKLPEYGKDNGLSVKPKMGDALLFWSVKPDGTLDPTSLHASSPVVKGDKWVGVKLMHVKAKDLTQEVMYIFIILNCI